MNSHSGNNQLVLLILVHLCVVHCSALLYCGRGPGQQQIRPAKKSMTQYCRFYLFIDMCKNCSCWRVRENNMSLEFNPIFGLNEQPCSHLCTSHSPRFSPHHKHPFQNPGYELCPLREHNGQKIF